MGLTQIHLIAVYSTAIVLVVALTFASGDDIILQKRSEKDPDVEDLPPPPERPSKRPFCNAFSGCGRKRSVDSLATLVDLNSEPAVEELSNRILSQAKLWEAIHEARDELKKHREDEQRILMQRNLPLALPMSNYRRKRAAVAEKLTHPVSELRQRKMER